MADSFFQWFVSKMDKIGYAETYGNDSADFTWLNFKSDRNQFHVAYIKHPIEAERIKNLFDTHNDPILFVVDSSLIDDKSIHFEMLRAIHALYYGRIYVWDGRGLGAIHHDRQSGVTTASEYIEINVIKFDHVDCWLKSFPGQFFIARFDEPASFWKGQAKQRQRKAPPPPDSAEEFFRKQYQQNTEDVFRDFKEAFERNKRTWYADPPEPKYQRGFPQYQPTGDKWLTMLLAEGTLDGAKKKFRELAHEYHPDKAGDSPEVVQVMQAINSAYARAKDILA